MFVFDDLPQKHRLFPTLGRSGLAGRAVRGLCLGESLVAGRQRQRTSLCQESCQSHTPGGHAARSLPRLLHRLRH